MIVHNKQRGKRFIIENNCDYYNHILSFFIHQGKRVVKVAVIVF